MLRRFPRNFKQLRVHVIKIHKSRNDIAYGFMSKYIYGLCILNDCVVMYPEIFAFLKHLKKKLRKKIKMLLNIAFNVPITRKANGLRMGKGKGPQKDWVCYLNKGQIFIEINIETQQDILDIKLALAEAKHKLSFNTKFIKLHY